jgi:hypothetical protein
MSPASKATLLWLGVLVGGLAAVLGLSKLHRAEPEVTLRLVDPADPKLILVNDSSVEADDVGYGVALYNVDNLPENGDTLPIEASGVEQLPPHHSYGPLRLFDAVEVRAWLKPGHRIVGTIAIDCATCARGYTYWVSLTSGEGGWFAEIKDMTEGGTVVPGDPDSAPLLGDDLKTELLERADDVAETDRVAVPAFTPSDLILRPPENARPAIVTPGETPSAKAHSSAAPSG